MLLKQILKGRQQLRKTPSDSDLFTHISYGFINSESEIEGRLYSRIPEIKTNLSKIKEKLKTDFDITETSTGQQSIDVGIFGVLNINDGNDKLINLVSKRENKVDVVEVVSQVIDIEKDRKDRGTEANAVLKQLSEANAHLQNAVTYIGERTEKEGIEEQLVSIEETISEIRKWLAENAGN